ncbi:terminase small subunit-like protein [Entomomonas asaccharolytica]|uniref:terminase small subunit-like protein n=1 Tax=Entomomonas asaccharolytica TaxID=2785331 RepID=UPI003638ED91
MIKWLKICIHRIIQGYLIARPIKYNEQLATNIIERLINGESLRAIYTFEDMPDKATVFR